MKVALILHSFSLNCSGFLFSIKVLFHEQHLQISGLQQMREGIFLTSDYRGGGHGGHPPNPTLFFENLLSKPMSLPMGCTPHLKMKPPSEKQTPPLKRKAPFHEMIPRKSTINNNLKSS